MFSPPKFGPDADQDRLSDDCETYLSTDPLDSDTDDDDLSDGDEYYKWGTRPELSDSDGHELPDGNEIFKYKTNPLWADSDSDRLTDDGELGLGLDPNDEDFDDDGIQDGDELNPYNGEPVTYPKVFDSDEDGLGMARRSTRGPTQWTRTPTTTA